MDISNVFLLAKQTCKIAVKQRPFYILWFLFLVLLMYAGLSGHQQMNRQNTIMNKYQEQARKSWINNPDKHPHRMAHFGSFAFRVRHPLSLFDFGMENFAGNAVFLEAHKQNSVNFSEASFSTGLLRLGELSIAMLLQLLLPLIIFFLGFNSIAGDRENGTLRLLLSQGVGIKSIITGRSLGLWLLSSLFFMPAFILTTVLLLLHGGDMPAAQTTGRLALLFFAYGIFYWVISAIAACVSASSITARSALVKLLGCWILLAIALPRVAQVAATQFFPSPTKLGFEAAVEKDILKQGDSHNPDDPFFKNIRDSILRKYKVDSVDKLPFNYGGLIGKTGERLSTETYIRHQEDLTNNHRRQIALSKSLAWINPFMMIRSNSMAFAGSDFEAYTNFQQQAEKYRYDLAQNMNELQMEYVSNARPSEGTHSLHIGKKHWAALEDFHYTFLTFNRTCWNERLSLAALACWLAVSFVGIAFISHRFKIIT